MSIPTYRTGFPQDGASLGSTKTQIRNNLDGTFETLGIDHINNNGSPGMGNPGYHNVIHFQDQGSANPSTVAGVTQEYTKTDLNAIQQIFLKSTGGNVYQQTRMIDGNFATFGSGPNGWTYLPGNMIFLYGTTGQSAADAVINFSSLGLPNFLTTNYFPMAVIQHGTSSFGSTSTYFIDLNTIAVTGFTIRNATTHTVGFIWYAIGV